VSPEAGKTASRRDQTALRDSGTSPVYAVGPREFGMVSPEPSPVYAVGPREFGMVSPEPREFGMVSPEPREFGMVSPEPREFGMVSPEPSEPGMVSPEPLSPEPQGIWYGVPGTPGMVSPEPRNPWDPGNSIWCPRNPVGPREFGMVSPEPRLESILKNARLSEEMKGSKPDHPLEAESGHDN
jgi:hypothetical protein